MTPRTIPAIKLDTLRFVVMLEEEGLSFIDSAFGGAVAAERRARACVDDALPRNTVAVYRAVSGGVWELWGRASISGDGGTTFERIK